MTVVTIDVGENEKRFLSQLSEQHNCTISEVVIEAVREYWEEEYYTYMANANIERQNV